MDSTDRYPKVRITGKLCCASNLHVGDGNMRAWESQYREKCGAELQGYFGSVCQRGDNDPYIPASSLRGFLHNRAKKHGWSPSKRQRLFGFAEGNQGRSGALRLYDAALHEPPAFPSEQSKPLLWSDTRNTSVRFGTALNPITGTVENRTLYQYEYVPAGTVFDFLMEGDCLDIDDIRAVLGLLRCWDGSPEAAIGKGASKGQGRMNCQVEKIEVLTLEKLQEWLVSDKDLKGYYTVLKETPEPSAELSQTSCSATVDIIPEAPFLVHDPAYQRRKESPEQTQPDHEFSRLPDGRAMIPAASLRGLIRARARRILATLAVQKGVPVEEAGSRVETLVRRLFGTTGNRSPLWFTDAEATTLSAPHSQTFNAIDRFTGGVADGKLYTANAADCGQLTCKVTLEKPRQPGGEWWKGLLVLLARDALEGDLAIGWGKAKGFGAFRVQIRMPDGENFGDWSALLSHLEASNQTTKVQGWLEALHTHLENHLNGDRS